MAPIENGENLGIDWQRVFAHCPHLLRLDLAQVSLNSKHAWKIVKVTSMHCRGVQALILPGDELLDHEPRKPNFSAIMSSVFQAMERWHQGPSGGLQQLFASKRHTQEEDAASDIASPDEFFENVARFCPNIEYLIGWKKSNFDSFNEDGNNVWLCSLVVRCAKLA